MNTILTLARRELGAYFLSPIAYIVAAIFLLLCGLAFGLAAFVPGGDVSLRGLLDPWIVLFLVILIPILTMRVVSEELRAGTIESLMTAPITETELVLGKYVGAMTFYLILLATLIFYVIILSMYGRVDVLLLLCHFLGLILLGAMATAAGVFFSACSKHQVIAGLLTILILPLFTLALDRLAQNVDGRIRAVLQHLSIYSHYKDFVLGRLELSHLVFFVSLTGLFLFLTVKRLEMRRWQ
jgi:ABC-2 type transport system permease protein